MLTFILFIYILVILLTVAFYTLLERKVIGYIHMRLGPNKIFFQGLLQPLMDAFKLLSKSYTIPFHANKYSYFSSPYFSLGISLFLWLIVVPIYYFFCSSPLSLIFFACVTSLMVFPLLVRGWSSNSKYTFIGSLRSVAQSISYEAVITTLIVLLICFFSTYSIKSIFVFRSSITCYLFFIWLFCTLAESHRAPFDFSERESELVSGYNTEYSGALFAFVFLAEYRTLLVSCFVITTLFLFFLPWSPVAIPIGALLISIILIVVRVTYCRYRYDLLIKTAWTSYLPTSLFLFLLYMSFSYMCI